MYYSVGFIINIFIRPHSSTTYVDAAYCYQPSSVVCRSVILVSSAKMAELIAMPFFSVEDSGGPKEPCIR